jgi:SAM-dependent methyltransferase
MVKQPKESERSLAVLYNKETSVGMGTAGCIICGYTDYVGTRWGGYYYNDRKYTIVKCLNCGFMFLNPLPNQEVLDNIYGGDEYFDTYYLTSSGAKPYIEGMMDFNAQDEEVIGLIKKFKATGSLLDVGCAAGHFLINARNSGYEVHGIEPNKKMAEYAKERFGLNIACGGLENGKFTGFSFDIIHTGDVLEHLLLIRENVDIIKYLLKDSGILVIEQPMMYNKTLFNLLLKLNMAFKKNRYSNNPPVHLWEFDSRTLPIFLKNMGFKLLYYKEFESRAKPLNMNKRLSIKNILGYHIKNISSYISNSILLKGLGVGDRALLVCKKC